METILQDLIEPSDEELIPVPVHQVLTVKMSPEMIAHLQIFRFFNKEEVKV